ncbi:MAG: C_GCAxxG_C_C family protein [Clostridia bacterium]|nr:C_GCAxxG_C_C family protein [Clostridia bacterium]
MNKGELAKENFTSGLNCSQAVVLAFKNELGLTEEQLKKLAIGYGGGVGRQRHVCGAVLGMTMVLSYLKSDGHDKLAIYDLIQKACGKIKQELGSIVCAELLDAKTLQDKSPVPEERTAKYYAKRPCADICKLVAEVTEKYLK